jgi:hypothetical protein
MHRVLSLLDEFLILLKEIDNNFSLTYNKYYIGLRQGNRANNFVIFKAKKAFLRVEIRIEDMDAVRDELKSADIEVIGVRERIRFVINRGDVAAHRDQIKAILSKAYKESIS